MKTCKFSYVLLALLILSCSKSDTNDSGGNNNNGTDSDYVLLLSEGGMLRTQFLNANASVVTMNPAQSSFVEKTIPDLKNTKATSFLQYHKTGNCSGTLVQHDFKTDTSIEKVVFDDLVDCDLTATSIIASDNSIFISYVLENTSPKSYMVRIIDTNATSFSYVDVILGKNPIDLALANNKLFILTIDDEITDENSISVLDLSSNNLVHEIALGYDAQRIFTDGNNNIIVSYAELHTTLDSSSMEVVYTQYEEATAPSFVSSSSRKFDVSGKLYYPSVSGSHSSYAQIPAVYDFSQNLTVLYAFENFLTESKRDIEFEIETTTSVSYDEANNLILIGYKKMGATDKGGLLRIRPVPNPAFIDNIDLDGIPYEIIKN